MFSIRRLVRAALVTVVLVVSPGIWASQELIQQAMAAQTRGDLAGATRLFEQADAWRAVLGHRGD